jgi:hypothetical protein
MNVDTIVQEVREARAEIAAEFGHDRARFWAWAIAQQEAEGQANHQPPTQNSSSTRISLCLKQRN